MMNKLWRYKVKMFGDNLRMGIYAGGLTLYDGLFQSLLMLNIEFGMVKEGSSSSWKDGYYDWAGTLASKLTELFKGLKDEDIANAYGEFITKLFFPFLTTPWQLSDKQVCEISKTLKISKNLKGSYTVNFSPNP